MWDGISNGIKRGEIISTSEVEEEIDYREEVLVSWLKSFSNFFVPLEPEVQINAKNILEHFPGLLDIKKMKSGADPFVIALAMLLNCKVVSEERLSNNSQKPKIPDVCKHYNIVCIKLVDLIRELKINL